MKKKKKKWLLWLGAAGFSLPLLFPTIMFIFLLFLFSAPQSISKNGSQGSYTDSWSTGDPYTHNLFVKRYGIKAEQLDGYLESTGIHYDKSRLNGRLLLRWEAESGVDARAIVAIAQMESSFGTAGVARLPGANMFGYGAFDSNPNNATQFSDEVAVVALAKQTLKANKNETFKIQDEKAQKYKNGTLNVSLEGGVYFTDTSGSGRKRADVMSTVNDWINSHGGTEKPPASNVSVASGDGGTLASYWNFPEEYRDKIEHPPTQRSLTNQPGSGYPTGQCTWYAYNRMIELGAITDLSGAYGYLGNGQDWVQSLVAKGWRYSTTPVKGGVISIQGGARWSDPRYGHVAVVEYVNPDGSFLISECNINGVQDKVHFSVLRPSPYYTFASPN